MGELCVSLLEVCRLAENGTEIEEMLEGGFGNRHQSLLLHEYLQQQQQEQEGGSNAVGSAALLHLPPQPSHPPRKHSSSTSSSNHNQHHSDESSAHPSNTTSTSNRLLQGGPCFSCQCTEAPQWRRPDPGTMLLCNRCGIHYMRYRKLPGPKKETAQPNVARFSAPSSPMHAGKRKATDAAWTSEPLLGVNSNSSQTHAPGHFSVGSYPGPLSSAPETLVPPHKTLSRQGSGNPTAAPTAQIIAADQPSSAVPLDNSLLSVRTRASVRRTSGGTGPGTQNASNASSGASLGVPASSSGPMDASPMAAAAATTAGTAKQPQQHAQAAGMPLQGAGSGQWGELWQALMGSGAAGGLPAATAGIGAANTFGLPLNMNMNMLNLASQVGAPPPLNGMPGVPLTASDLPAASLAAATHPMHHLLPLHGLPAPSAPAYPPLSIPPTTCSMFAHLSPTLSGGAMPFPLPGLHGLPPFTAGTPTTAAPALHPLMPLNPHVLGASQPPAAKKAAAAPPVSAMFSAAFHGTNGTSTQPSLRTPSNSILGGPTSTAFPPPLHPAPSDLISPTGADGSTAAVGLQPSLLPSSNSSSEGQVQAQLQSLQQLNPPQQPTHNHCDNSSISSSNGSTSGNDALQMLMAATGGAAATTLPLNNPAFGLFPFLQQQQQMQLPRPVVDRPPTPTGAGLACGLMAGTHATAAAHGI